MATIESQNPSGSHLEPSAKATTSERPVIPEKSLTAPPGLAQDPVVRNGLPITVEDLCGEEDR
jgi:hypothetical protein